MTPDNLTESGECIKGYQDCCLEPLELQGHAHVLESQQRLHHGNASVQPPFLSFRCSVYLPTQDKCICISFKNIPIN
jgi:hypothetical protein